MSSEEEWRYRPPPPSLTSLPESYSIPLDDLGLHEILVEYTTYREFVVEYSIVQRYRPAIDAPWEPVYRADTKHSDIHDHHGGRMKGLEYRTREHLHPANAWERVDHWFGFLLDQTIKNADTRLRRWLEC